MVGRKQQLHRAHGLAQFEARDCAPASGSIAVNGRAAAEQIGAQGPNAGSTRTSAARQFGCTRCAGGLATGHGGRCARPNQQTVEDHLRVLAGISSTDLSVNAGWGSRDSKGRM